MITKLRYKEKSLHFIVLDYSTSTDSGRPVIFSKPGKTSNEPEVGDSVKDQETGEPIVSAVLVIPEKKMGPAGKKIVTTDENGLVTSVEHEQPEDAPSEERNIAFEAKMRNRQRQLNKTKTKPKAKRSWLPWHS